MEQLIVEIKDSSKKNILLDLLKQLDFIEVKPFTKNKAAQRQIKFANALKETMSDVELYLQSKKRL